MDFVYNQYKFYIIFILPKISFYSMKKYTPYYRVSTKHQGRSGLGLEAQKNAVLQFVRGNKESLVGSFQEVESTKAWKVGVPSQS